MQAEKWFRDLLGSLEEDFDFRLESIILDLTEKITKTMRRKGINRTGLADRLNVSPPAVTKILNGNSNFTLRTLLSLADVLEMELQVDLRDKGAVQPPAFYIVSSSDYDYQQMIEPKGISGVTANEVAELPTLFHPGTPQAI
jgi:transcriptional regulator with XRE-family HTH domain